MPDSVAVKALAIALVMAAAASAQTSSRTVQLRYVPVERAIEAARAVSGVVVTGDRRTNRLVLSGPAAAVGKASELAVRADLPPVPRLLTLFVNEIGAPNTFVWNGILSAQPGRATSFSIETPGGLSERLGATAVKGRLWIEGGPVKLAVRGEVQVKTAAGAEDLRGSGVIEHHIAETIARGATTSLYVQLEAGR